MALPLAVTRTAELPPTRRNHPGRLAVARQVWQHTLFVTTWTAIPALAGTALLTYLYGRGTSYYCQSVAAELSWWACALATAVVALVALGGLHPAPSHRR
jgi:hypothetical protein